MSTTDPSRSPETAPGDGLAGREGLDQVFDGHSLYALRAAVAAHASEAGLSRTRVYDIVAAAHELAANAVRHGAGHGRLRLRSDGRVLHCEVRDDGPAAVAPAGNGQEPAPGGTPPWATEHGHGLWMVSQIADQFTLDHGPAGTTATAAFTISPASGPGSGRNRRSAGSPR
jgi:anti-sigma regulatory factor (Ser/Thr protein kinase)